MEIQCTHCGTTLPKDNARFCTQCGKPAPVNTIDQAPPLPGLSDEKRDNENGNNLAKGQQQEQAIEMSQQSFTYSEENSAQSREQKSLSSIDRQDQDAEVMPEILPAAEQSDQAEATLAHPMLQNAPMVRELHVKVWKPEEQEEAAHQQNPLTPEPLVVQSSDEWRQTPPIAVSLSPVPQSTNSRQRIFTFVVLPLLVFAILAGWVYVYQPFTIPAITEPQQHFQDSHVGISILYPTGWTAQADQHAVTVHFYDSTHTAQVNIMATNADTTGVTQYLQKEAAQLGMTNLNTGAPLTFAGTSWQQLQGIVQQNGANYTEILFTTTHGNHLITMAQLAPKETYKEEEQINFSSMRSSLQVL